MGGVLRRLLGALLVERPAWSALQGCCWYPWAVVATVCVGAFMGQLDASIVALALPALQDAFGLPLADVEWVALTYLLALAGLVVVFGRVADLVGRKALYTMGFAVFTVGSALCGLALGFSVLLGARLLQGVGAAMLQANSVALITQAAPRRMLGRAIGIQGAAQAVGLAVGPALGGMLVQVLGWRWIFVINVPVGLLAMVLVLPVTPGPRRAEPFDVVGALLFVAGVVLLMYGVTHGQVLGWMSPRFLVLVGGAGGLLMAFLLVASRVPHPLIDLGLFRRVSFSAGIAAGLFSYAVLFGALFLIPLFLQRVAGMGPAAAGGLTVAVPAALGVAAPLSGVVADRHGARWVTVGGMVVAVVALVLLARPFSGWLALLVPLVLLGLGLGLFTPANNAAIMAVVPPARFGVAAGVLNMTRSLGTSLGVAVMGAVLEWWLRSFGAVAGSWLAGGVVAPAFRESLLVLVVLALVGALVSLVRGAPGSVAFDDEVGAVVREL